jgi:uncharacterized protein (DUF1499 family)
MLAQASAHWAAALILLSVILMLASPLGYRLRLWSAATALTRVVALGLVLGALAAILALVSLAAGAWRVGPGTTIMLVVFAAIGAAAIILPVRAGRTAKRTPFNDVSTDTADPPAFEAVLAARRTELPDAAAGYDRARLAVLQQRTYPDLGPLRLAAAPDQVFVRASDAARRMGWRVVAEDEVQGRIEASDRSLWFGFTDDIVVRLRPDGTGTRVDLRSASRVGISDLGKNAARIRKYFAMLGGG